MRPSRRRPCLPSVEHGKRPAVVRHQRKSFLRIDLQSISRQFGNVVSGAYTPVLAKFSNRTYVTGRIGGNSEVTRNSPRVRVARNEALRKFSVTRKCSRFESPLTGWPSNSTLESTSLVPSRVTSPQSLPSPRRSATMTSSAARRKLAPSLHQKPNVGWFIVSMHCSA